MDQMVMAPSLASAGVCSGQNLPTQRCGGKIAEVRPTTLAHVYEVRPRKDKRGVDLISDVLPFGQLWYDTPDNAIGYAVHYSRSHDAVIRVYDAARKVIETHEHKGDFKEFRSYSNRKTVRVQLYYSKAWDLKRRRNPRSGGRSPSKTKKEERKDR